MYIYIMITFLRMHISVSFSAADICCMYPVRYRHDISFWVGADFVDDSFKIVVYDMCLSMFILYIYICVYVCGYIYIYIYIYLKHRLTLFF